MPVIWSGHGRVSRTTPRSVTWSPHCRDRRDAPPDRRRRARPDEADRRARQHDRGPIVDGRLVDALHAGHRRRGSRHLRAQPEVHSGLLGLENVVLVRTGLGHRGDAVNGDAVRRGVACGSPREPHACEPSRLNHGRAWSRHGRARSSWASPGARLVRGPPTSWTPIGGPSRSEKQDGHGGERSRSRPA